MQIVPRRFPLVLAAFAPLSGLFGQDQGAAEDWPKHVEKACTAPRYGVRLAAAKKVAEAGDAAVPALRAFCTQHGANALASSLVDAIADTLPGKGGVEMLRLLEQWAKDGEFYWRAAALRGVAQRMPQLLRETDDEYVDPNPVFRYRDLFRAYQDDPAWLMRTHARFGLFLLAPRLGVEAPRPEADPRATVRLTRLELLHSDQIGLQPLLDALADERTFLGDPWGMRAAQEAHQALKDWLGDAFPPPRDGDDKPTAIARIRDAAQAKSGQTLTVPGLRVDATPGVTGGIEILSCRSGDRFVQWTDAGVLWFGIDASRRVELPAAAWQPLLQSRTQLALGQNLGVVICDKMRVRLHEPDVHVTVAPQSLPAPAADWLKQLAQRLEEAGHTDVAAALRRNLEQFVGP